MGYWTKSFLAAAFAASLILIPARGDDAPPPKPGYSVQKTLPIGGEGRWDYATFDPDAHLLYVTRSTHTQVIDPATGKVVADIPGQKQAHGVAIDVSLHRGFITDSGDDSIVIFDTKTAKVLGKAAGADDADGIIFDPGTNLVLATCRDAGKLAVLKPDADPKSAKADVIDLGGKPEFLAADGNGKAFVNLNDKNEVAVVDLKKQSVIARWPIGSGTSPTGLAIDTQHHRLFVGCRNEKMIVLSTDDGHVVAELPIGKGNDACACDVQLGRVLASCGDGTLNIVYEIDDSQYKPTWIKTRPGARTLALDPTTRNIYLPTAEMEKPAAPGKRPNVKPDTFMIVVVGPVEY